MRIFSIIVLVLVLCLTLACTENDPINVEEVIVSIDDLNIDEGNEDKSFFVKARLSAPATEDIQIQLGTLDESATEGEDYVAIENYFHTFLKGQSIHDFKIEILGDEEFENDEDFIIEVVYPQNEKNKNGKITIVNDDPDTIKIIPSGGYISADSYTGMEMIWSDEFNVGENLEKYWTFEYGDHGWGNNEWQNYKKSNTTIHDGGYLVIEARKEAGTNNYSSSRIITRDKFEFQYGRVDIRAALPYGQGIWPALWMLGENLSSVGWPACGEIDIMELIGHQAATTHGTIHWSNNGDHSSYGKSKKLSSGIFSDEFHVFSIIWNEESIEWYLDDIKFMTADIAPSGLSEFHNKFFFIFNVAVGGNWPGYPDQSTVFPQRMIVDYIRVFQ